MMYMAAWLAWPSIRAVARRMGPSREDVVVCDRCLCPVEIEFSLIWTPDYSGTSHESMWQGTQIRPYLGIAERVC